MNVDVPIVFKGEESSPGVKKGGYIQRLRDSLRYQGPVEHIPSKIEVDVSKLDIGDRLHLSDLKVHPSLKLLSIAQNKPLCKVRGTKPKVVELETVPAEETELALV